MRRFGLIGKSLEHSFSADYFAQKFKREEIDDAEYVNCSIPSIGEFKSISEDSSFVGWNVTIPYKESIIPLLDDLSEDARTIGAVNTISRKKGKLIGHNTDHIGFSRSIAPFLEPSDQKAIILGSGGANKAVAYALDQKGIIHKTISRNPTGDQLSYDALPSVLPYIDILVNTTPLGTFPGVDEHPPIPFENIEEKHFIVDLIYNPQQTHLLRQAEERGARNLNGLSMLHFQAEEAWKIWNRE